MSQHRQGDAGAGAAMGGGDENQVCGAQGVLRIDEARQPPASPLPTAPYPALASIRPLEPWVSTIAIQTRRLPCAAYEALQKHSCHQGQGSLTTLSVWQASPFKRERLTRCIGINWTLSAN